jgi:hypothetical protein
MRLSIACQESRKPHRGTVAFILVVNLISEARVVEGESDRQTSYSCSHLSLYNKTTEQPIK